MKVLFLDVDGVLNAHEFDPDVLCGQIHRDKVAVLNRVLRETGAKVVLSSAWRYIVHRGEATLMGMEWLLRSHGMLAGRLVGITREDTMVRDAYRGDPASWPQTDERGRQITDWLREWDRNEWAKETGTPPPVACPDLVTGYAVVDDLDPGITAAGHPFVRTDGTVGLTVPIANRLIDILNGGRERW